MWLARSTCERQYKFDKVQVRPRFITEVFGDGTAELPASHQIDVTVIGDAVYGKDCRAWMNQRHAVFGRRVVQVELSLVQRPRHGHLLPIQPPAGGYCDKITIYVTDVFGPWRDTWFVKQRDLYPQPRQPIDQAHSVSVPTA